MTMRKPKRKPKLEVQGEFHARPHKLIRKHMAYKESRATKPDTFAPYSRFRSFKVKAKDAKSIRRAVAPEGIIRGPDESQATRRGRA